MTKEKKRRRQKKRMIKDLKVMLFCRLAGRHNTFLLGRDLAAKYGKEYAAHPDRICGRCGRRETWFASYRGKAVYIAPDEDKTGIDPHF